MPKTTTDIDYQALSAELESILSNLQSDDVPIDAALTQYERGLSIVKQLEEYLKTAENKVEKLRTKFDASAADTA